MANEGENGQNKRVRKSCTEGTVGSRLEEAGRPSSGFQTSDSSPGLFSFKEGGNHAILVTDVKL